MLLNKVVKAISLLMFLLASPCWATNHYILASASGTGTGADWTNACTDFAGTNCAPGNMVRGDTYYVGLGSYIQNSYTFNVTVSGTTPITIKHATIADHGTGTGWSDSFAGVATFGSLHFSTSYWTVTGVSRTNMSSGYGFVIDCSVTPAGGCDNMMEIDNANTVGIILQYIEFKGLSYHSNTVDGGPYTYCQTALHASAGDGTGKSFAASYNYIHDLYYSFVIAATSGASIAYNYMARGGSNTYCHGQALEGEYDSNLTIANNVFQDQGGTAYLVVLNRGGAPGIADGWKIYGNTLVTSDPPVAGGLAGNGPGAICCINSENCTNWVIANNSFINQQYGTSPNCKISMAEAGLSTASITVENNMFYGCTNARYSDSSPASITATHNWFDSTTSYNASEVSPQIYTGNPFINWNGGTGEFLLFELLGPTTAGVTLSSPYNVDAVGAIRGADGTWDRGALEFTLRSVFPNTVLKNVVVH